LLHIYVAQASSCPSCPKCPVVPITLFAGYPFPSMLCADRDAGLAINCAKSEMQAVLNMVVLTMGCVLLIRVACRTFPLSFAPWLLVVRACGESCLGRNQAGPVLPSDWAVSSSLLLVRTAAICPVAHPCGHPSFRQALLLQTACCPYAGCLARVWTATQSLFTTRQDLRTAGLSAQQKVGCEQRCVPAG
jgi:hypothetical protein